MRRTSGLRECIFPGFVVAAGLSSGRDRCYECGRAGGRSRGRGRRRGRSLARGGHVSGRAQDYLGGDCAGGSSATRYLLGLSIGASGRRRAYVHVIGHSYGRLRG